MLRSTKTLALFWDVTERCPTITKRRMRYFQSIQRYTRLVELRTGGIFICNVWLNQHRYPGRLREPCRLLNLITNRLGLLGSRRVR